MTMSYRTATTPSDAMLVLTNIGAEPTSFSASRQHVSPAPEQPKIVQLHRRSLPFTLS